MSEVASQVRRFPHPTQTETPTLVSSTCNLDQAINTAHDTQPTKATAKSSRLNAPRRTRALKQRQTGETTYVSPGSFVNPPVYLLAQPYPSRLPDAARAFLRDDATLEGLTTPVPAGLHTHLDTHLRRPLVYVVKHLPALLAAVLILVTVIDILEYQH